jgi:hypothetical protein
MSRGVLARKVESAAAARAKASSKAASGRLRIGDPDDAFEHEADRMADQVMAGGRTRPEWSLSRMSIEPPLQRKCACGGEGGAKGECEDCKAKKMLQRKAAGPAQNSEAPPIVHEVLNTPGQPLDRTTRNFFEHRFGYDFSRVRLHTGTSASESAESVNALAYTVGNHVVFGAGQYSPATAAGRRLVAHELAHTMQQEHAESTGGLRNSSMIARQAKPDAEAGQNDSEDQPKDTFAGTKITEIVVSLARRRVGFRWSAGMILGNITTDLKAGTYQLKADVPNRKWVIQTQGVKSGVRFDVDLEGADPWTLSYPETLTLTVAPGSTVEPKTFGDMQADGKLTDPLWLYEGGSDKDKIKPPKGIDDFESTRYDLSYRSEKGVLSKWITASYRDNSVKDINIDSITEATPRLWAAKKEVLKVMDDYNAMFILGAFPTVFFIITITPMAPIPGRTGGYVANRRSFPKTGGGGGKFEPPTGGNVRPGGETEPPVGAPRQEPGTDPAPPPKAAENEPPTGTPRQDTKANQPGEAAGAPQVPQGMTEQQFQQMSQKVRAGTSQYGNDVRVHGSRASGTARPDSDVDIAVRVDKQKFDQVIQERFGKPNPGSAKERTMLNAVKTGKIQAGEAGLRGLRQSVAKDIGMDVDISVVKVGGEFDNGPWIPLR